jgi:capsular polysaccharide biosynthesis protein
MVASLEFKEKAPCTVDNNVYFKFDSREILQPEAYVLELKAGRVFGNAGAVITHDDILISEVSMQFGQAKFDISKHSAFSQIKLRKPDRRYKILAVLASPGSNVYAHWLCDVFPRFLLLLNNGLLDKIDKVVINLSKNSYQLECLKAINFPMEKILNCNNEMNLHLMPDLLYVPSYPNIHGFLSTWVSDELNKIFKKDIIQISTFSAKRIYISRSRDIGRKLINEQQILDFLTMEYGFEMIHAQDYSIHEKAQIFGNAQCIIGPHGSGLVNAIFAESNCTLINIFPPGDVDTFVWSIANVNKLNYYYYFGEGILPTPDNDFTDRNADITINLEDFKSFMKKINLPLQ